MSKIKLCYFGSKISTYRKSNAAMETLEPLLKEYYDFKSYSNKENKVLKLIDMMFNFFYDGLKSDYILIDVFSTNAIVYARILALLSRVFKKKYILVLRGGNLPKRYQNYPRMMSKMFSRAYKVVAPSYYLKEFFEEKGFEIFYIPNIIEIEKYPFKHREGIRPNILALRGFGKPYNPIMTLEATKVLKERGIDVKLLLLGNKEEYYYNEVLTYIKNNNLETVVTVQRKVSRDEWVTISKNYDIMVSNPVIDNTPVSVIEGMALGMYVISTNVGGVPYLLNDKIDSFLITNGSVDELVSKIEFLIKYRQDITSISYCARKKAEEFSWEKIKLNWLSILT